MCIYTVLIPIVGIVTIVCTHRYKITIYFIYYNRLKIVMYVLNKLKPLIQKYKRLSPRESCCYMN